MARARFALPAAWLKTAMGGWVLTLPDGARWTVRDVSARPKRMFWLYYKPAGQRGGGSRFTPTGHYSDSVNFPTAAAARRFAEAQIRTAGEPEVNRG